MVRDEKAFSEVERTENYSVEVILQQITGAGVTKAPCPQFKEWTNDGRGLECTLLATVIPPVLPGIALGLLYFEPEPVQMARCNVTTDHLLDRCGVQVEPAAFTAPYWWLLVTAPSVDTLISPQHLLACRESFRTSTGKKYFYSSKSSTGIGQSEIQRVAKAGVISCFALSADPFIGRVDSHLCGTAALKSSVELFGHLGPGKR